ncbi:MAG: 30S ribosomal protein S4 [Candidatus Thorarchaeota archaeon]|jgi:small subunit ribosomal protein S4
MMGDPRRQKKKYATPKRPFDSDRFEQELQFIGSYGLRNKKELWRHRTKLSNYRRQARNLLAVSEAERAQTEKELVEKLLRQGILKTEPTLDHVLDLTLEDILDRRLQTIVFRKGLACSMYHARQLVTHGHIALDAARVTTPSRIMTVTEEDRLGYTTKSPLGDDSHPARIAASDAAKRASLPPEPVPEEEFRQDRRGRRGPPRRGSNTGGGPRR